MTFFVQPHFNWPPVRSWTGGWDQQVVLTAAGAAYYNELLGTTALAMDQVVGRISASGDCATLVEVYHPAGYYMGQADNRLKAAEELVKIYARQADSLTR